MLSRKKLARAAAIWNPCRPLAYHTTLLLHVISPPASSVATRVFGSTSRLMTTMMTKDNDDNVRAKAAANAWCCTASITPNVTTNGSDVVEIQKVQGYSDDESDCQPFVQILEHIATDESAATSSSSSSSSLLQLDLTTSPDWMQFIEFKEDRQHDEGGAGAYDTLRCDLILSSSQNNDTHHNNNKQTTTTEDDDPQQWRIWGRDFHLQRLEKSFASLLVAAGAAATNHHPGTDRQKNAVVLKSGAMERAIQDSHRILDALLAEAAASPILNRQLQQQQPNQLDATTKTTTRKYVTIQLIKFTWLWSLSKPKTNDDSSNEQGFSHNNSHHHIARDIVVRGHACCSGKPMPIHCPIVPIVATIAAHATRQKLNNDANKSSSSISWSLDASLPTRHGDDDDEHDHYNPEQKVASWTRMRKKLEHGDDHQHTYKPIGFPNAEVLMVRKAAAFHDNKHDNKDEFQVLEGISSNFFAIYRNGTIKTATKGVLYGYARQLVLDIVEQQSNVSESSSPISSLGLRFVDEPILLSESSEWVETFITSSSRLIYPISSILMHTTNTNSMTSNDNVKNQKAPVNIDNDDSIVQIPAGFEIFWIDPVLTRSQQQEQETTSSTFVKPKWQIILDEILRRNGYP